MRVQTADGIIVSDLVLQFPADIAQLLLQLDFNGLEVALQVRDQSLPKLLEGLLGLLLMGFYEAFCFVPVVVLV